MCFVYPNDNNFLQIWGGVCGATPTTPDQILRGASRRVTRAGSAPPPGSCSEKREFSAPRCRATASPAPRTDPPGAPSGRGATRSGPAGTRAAWRCTPASAGTSSVTTTVSFCPSSMSGSQ